jgi:hypothetical protein
MKSNKLIWGFTALVVLITIAVSLGTMTGHSQKDMSKEQNNSGVKDLTKYPVVDYAAPLPVNDIEREERIRKNKRYDTQDWVIKTPHPDTSGVGLIDEIPPPPVIPVSESNLIIIGEVTTANAYLSNDKKGIYSEYAVRVKDVLKEDGSNKIESGNSIVMDRRGGCLRYPNGQKVYYLASGEDLPEVGKRYVLFLTTDKQSPNYKILTGYEIKDSKIAPLDNSPPFRNLPETRQLNFIQMIRDKISSASQPIKNQENL